MRKISGLILVSIFIFSGISFADITSNLIGHWTFDEATGSTAADTGSGGNNLTLTNSPIWTTGVLNSALTFNGTTNYVTKASTNFGLDGTAILTVSAWIRTDLSHQGSVIQKHVAAADETFDTFSIIVNTDGSVRSTVQNYAGGFGKYPAWTTPIGTIQANTWTLVTFVYNLIAGDATDMTVYINGVVQSAAFDPGGTGNNLYDNTFTLGENSANFIIGGRFTTSVAKYFSGIIDDVRIYNRALSGADVLALYALPPSIPTYKLPSNSIVD